MQCISYSSVLKTQLEIFSKKKKKKKKNTGTYCFVFENEISRIKITANIFPLVYPSFKQKGCLRNEFLAQIFFELVYRYFQQNGCLGEELLNQFFLLVNIYLN